jgi:hypothetical protein
VEAVFPGEVFRSFPDDFDRFLRNLVAVFFDLGMADGLKVSNNTNICLVQINEKWYICLLFDSI